MRADPWEEVSMSFDYTDELRAFDAHLSERHMRGQWQFAAAVPEGKGGADLRSEPQAAGVPYLWRWVDVEPLIAASCKALPESFTARRALAFKNPALPRCTAQTIQMSVQVIRPGEIAWAHRHSIAAIRFVISGNSSLHTVVDGVPYTMKDNDLILTPSWTWHDHHNDSDDVALWLDVLDVPLVGMLHQGFYEEFGNSTQPIRNRSEAGNTGLRPAWSSEAESYLADFRYSWSDTEEVLKAFDGAQGSLHDGIILDYVNRVTLGPTLKTLNCQVQRLPPGFSGRPHRHTSSAVYFVVSGEGITEARQAEMRWSMRDCFVVPNWTWHRHVNRSERKEAILFTVNDAPVMRALGFYRAEDG
jgi:gentisate 1,2-dioxygenase